MKKTWSFFYLLALLLSTVVLLSLGCSKQGEANSGTKNEIQNQNESITEPSKKTETSESVQKNVDSTAQQEIWKKRSEIIQEAFQAIRETENAQTALDSGNSKTALRALELATGKLELILARDPKLALAPVDVSMTTHDVLLSLDAIKEIRKNAEKLLKDGEIQQVRNIISNLGSEIVVSVTSIPLATYPAAIKAVTPLIDKGKIAEAKIALGNALRTLVITDHIIPLPVVRAEEMLLKAEKIAEKPDRATQGNDSLTMLLKNARYQLQMAEALGYGDKKDYTTFYAQLNEIEKKTENGKSGIGFFDSVKSSIGELKKKVFK